MATVLFGVFHPVAHFEDDLVGSDIERAAPATCPPEADPTRERSIAHEPQGFQKCGLLRGLDQFASATDCQAMPRFFIARPMAICGFFSMPPKTLPLFLPPQKTFFGILLDIGGGYYRLTCEVGVGCGKGSRRGLRAGCVACSISTNFWDATV